VQKKIAARAGLLSNGAELQRNAADGLFMRPSYLIKHQLEAGRKDERENW
jgi:hypothetical protein